MISLISRWKLRNGCSEPLKAALNDLAGAVREHEPGTLAYAVHIEALNTLDAKGSPLNPPPMPIPGEQQMEVVFFEVYENTAALQAHLGGTAFTTFKKDWADQFYMDPAGSGWPVTETTYLERESAFFRT